MTVLDVKNIGLRGVTVADTKISLVDGVQGLLLYRGYHIRDLAEQTTYEEVVFLLLFGRLPNRDELSSIRIKLAESRQLPAAVIDYLRLRANNGQTMDVIQGAVTMLADYDDDLALTSRAAIARSSVRLISRLAVVTATWNSIKAGKPVVEPDTSPDVSHAGILMGMLLGRKISADEERLMDILLILHAEHTFNASTFTARQVASTMAHLYASSAAAVGALSGRLHGGANARVMEMLIEIGGIEKVDEWMAARIAAHKRIMGLGHAVYKTEDPRAKILREIAQKALVGEQEIWWRLAIKVEEVGRTLLVEKRGLALYPNVDFYSGPILYAIGMSTDMFPAFFAVSRVAGWSAHVIEEQFAEAQPKPTIYRPRSYYVGPYAGPEGCKLVPLHKRGSGITYGKDFEKFTSVEG